MALFYLTIITVDLKKIPEYPVFKPGLNLILIIDYPRMVVRILDSICKSYRTNFYLSYVKTKF